MSLLQLKPHDKDLGGGFHVRRLLPSVLKQAIGPFIFFDHFGPTELPAHAQTDVRAHPHIGLATVTYLFEGAMDHRDSVGSVQRIEPGAINLMTAGSGIVHSERTPPELKDKPHRVHGLQLWCALPAEHEETAPRFAHTPAAAIPLVSLPGAAVRVMIGSAYGVTSPVQTLSETFYLDVQLAAGSELRLSGLPQEAAIYPVDGSLTLGTMTLEAQLMHVLDTSVPNVVASANGARFVVIGGAPLGHRFMWWNFVSSRKERILEAAKLWQERGFAHVPGETEFIPLPERLPNF